MPRKPRPNLEYRQAPADLACIEVRLKPPHGGRPSLWVPYMTRANEAEAERVIEQLRLHPLDEETEEMMPMSIESIAGATKYRVSPTDPHMVQMQERHGARWVDTIRTLSLREANAIVLKLARRGQDETQEIETVKE